MLNLTCGRGLRATAAALAAALAGLAALAGGSAHAQPKMQQSFILETAAADVPAKPRRVGKRGHLMPVTLWAPDAVKIDQAVEVAELNAAGAVTARRTIPAGAVLLGSPNKPGIYCLPIHEDYMLWNTRTACLADLDNDKRFEAGLTAAYSPDRRDNFVVSSIGGLLRIRYDAQAPLAAPVAYQPTDPHAGPPVRVGLKWLGEAPKQPGVPVRIGLMFQALKSAGGFGETEPQVFDLPNGVGDLVFHGLTIHVLGFDSGALRYTIDRAPTPPAEPQRIDMAFRFVNAPTTIYVYY